MAKYIVICAGMITGGAACEGASPLAGVGERILDVPSDTNLGTLMGRPYLAISGDYEAGQVGTPHMRRIRVDVFRRRWTEDEEIALEQAQESATQSGRALRVILRRLYDRSHVDLDDADFVSMLQRLSARLLAGGIWPDQAVADSRLEALRADGTPGDQ